MNVLITGAGGFLGRHLAHYYAHQGHDVVGCGRGSWPEGDYTQWGLQAWYAGAVTLELLQNIPIVPDLIVHCAGGASVMRSVQYPFVDFRDTVDGSAAVLEYARIHCPAARIIYPSSPAVQGVHDNSPILTIDANKPVSPYGFHKMMAENLCTSYRLGFGLDITIIRFFSVYGEGLRKQLLWDASLKMTSGGQIAEFWGDGYETRDWIHVSDAVALVATVARTNSCDLPMVLNCGGGEAFTTHDVLSKLRSCLGVTTEISFNGVVRAGDPRYYWADISAALALGWRPCISLEQGLQEYANWFGARDD